MIFRYWVLVCLGFSLCFLFILLRFGGASLNLWLKFFWPSWKMLVNVLPIKAPASFSISSSSLTFYTDIRSFSLCTMCLLYTSQYFLFLYSFCASVWILYIILSSNSLILSFSISSTLIFIYWVLNFTLSYVRISLVKLSISLSIFLNVVTFSNVCVWWLQHLDHLSVEYCGNNLRLFLRSSWGKFSFFCGVESD